MSVIPKALFSPVMRLSKAISRQGLAPFLRAECETLRPQDRVLSVGGGGLVDSLLAEARRRREFSWIRLDIEPRTRPDVIADITEWRSDNAFDCVFLSEVLEHTRAPWKAIEHVHASLAPRGRLVLTVPFLLPVHHVTDDYYRFTRHGLEALLETFETVEISERNSWAESYAVLLARSVKPYNRALKLLAPFLVVLAALLFPPLWLLGRLLPSGYMTTGYNVLARKRAARAAAS